MKANAKENTGEDYAVVAMQLGKERGKLRNIKSSGEMEH